MAFAFFIRLIACLAAVLLSIAVAESDASSRSQANVRSNAETSCAWDCKVVDSKFGLDMKALISEFRLITVQLKYDQQEDKKCLNQTNLQNSSIKLAELWTWLTGNTNPSHGGQNMSQHFFNKSDYWFQKSFEEQTEVGVLCSLNPETDSNDTNPSLNDVIAMVLMEEVAKFAELPHSKTALCYKLLANNGSYVCVNLTRNTAHNMYEISPGVTWQKHVFRVLLVVILVISSWYFPLILCLFTPTEFKEKETGRDMLVLSGTSPKSIRSWIANHLSLFNDSKNWKRTLGAFLFLLMALAYEKLELVAIDVYLPPANLFTDIDTLPSRLLVMLYSSILISTIIFARLFSSLYFGKTSCFICRVFGDKEDIFHDKENPEYYGLKEMKMHLLIQPSIVKRCFTQFLSISAYLHNCCIPWRLVAWLLVLLLVPLWFPIYLLYVTWLLLYSSPLMTFFFMLKTQHFGRGGGCCSLLETNFILCGSLSITLDIASDSVTIIRGCFMRLPNYLPYASLGLVTVYYLWKVYSPFPRKYNVLAFKLYIHYTAEKKKQGVQKLRKGYIPQPKTKNNSEIKLHRYKRYRTKQAGAKNKPVCYKQDCLRVIPKDLYDGACRKLMPLQESKNELDIYFFVIVIVSFAVFVIITESSRIDDETKAVGTLLAILFPTIREMFFGEDPEEKKADDDVFDKKVASVVKEYLSKTQKRKSNIANQNTNSNNNCTSGGNGGLQIANETENVDSDNGSSEGNERYSSCDNIPLLSCQYGTFDDSGNTSRRRTATGALSPTSETIV